MRRGTRWGSRRCLDGRFEQSEREGVRTSHNQVRTSHNLGIEQKLRFAVKRSPINA